MDQSETTFYLGGSNGKIYILDISSQVTNKFLLIFTYIFFEEF